MTLVESESPTLRRSRDLDRSTVWLRGEQDLSTVGAVNAALADAIARSDDDIVVDLSAVTFLSVTTVGVVIRARASLGRQSRSLILRSPSPTARRTLGLSASRRARR